MIFRPVFAVLVMTGLLYLSSGWFEPLTVADDPGAEPYLSILDDDVFRMHPLVELNTCLRRLVAVNSAQAARQHAESGQPFIEHWYRRNCRSLVHAPPFERFARSYGARSLGVVLTVLDEEEALVALAIDDPSVTDEQLVALWRVGLASALARLELFEEALAALYVDLDPRGDAAVPEVGSDVPPAR